MQIIVLGMHRSGTSAVARLLNMMGAYFSPSDVAMQPDNANSKGYWEREDIRQINDQILDKLGMTWEKIAKFDKALLEPEEFSDLQYEMRKVIYNLDAHRPWMAKDPRFCLTLPLWLPLLEIPICIYVHRDPIQIAQSLQTRSNSSLQLGLALWEKHTIHALQAIATHKLPHIFISYEETLSDPVGQVQKIYDQLAALGIQGLRLPHAQEITAFIDPELHHEKGGETLQATYMTPQQIKLHKFLEQGNGEQWEGNFAISAHADEVLLQHETTEQQLQLVKEQTINHVASFETEHQHLQQDISNLNQHIIKLEKNISHYQHRIPIYQQQLLDMRAVLDTKIQLEQKYDELNRQFDALKKENESLRPLVEEVAKKEAAVQRLLNWIQALNHDMNAIFSSLTWRSGDILTQIILKLLFRQAGATAKDNIAKTIQSVTQWQNTHSSYRVVTPTVHTASPVSVVDQITGVVQQRGSRDHEYWIKHYDTPSEQLYQDIKIYMAGWVDPPVISIVMPVYNAPEKFLRKALDSITSQLYPHWELCIADDASTEAHVKRVLTEYERSDKRIKVIYRKENGHISKASNSALTLVTSEFTAFMDHDDALPAHALFWMAKDILDNPDGMLWYSDEDKIDEEGNRYDLHFKPDWNHDLLLSYNYLNHFSIYKTSLVKQLKGFRSEYNGAQDYDLALRAIECIKPEQIHHVPRVLYHWRAISGSTAANMDEKPYTVLAGQKAVGDYLKRQGLHAKVLDNPQLAGVIRVQYQLPANPPLVSLIIPTYNGLSVLSCCVDSILNKTTYPNYEIIIVDNRSDDDATLQYLLDLESTGKARILRYPHPFNYPAINNMAVEHASGELVALINNDLEVITPNWLDEMVGQLLRPQVGAVGARLWYPDERLQHGGVIVGLGGVAGHSHKYLPKGDPGYFGRAAVIQNLSAVTAACLLTYKETYIKVGGLDAKNLAVAFNDVDFCLKIQSEKLRIVWTPYAELYHHESASRGQEDTPEKQARFEKEVMYMKKRWYDSYLGELMYDPAYSPNLIAGVEDFGFAFPPRIPMSPLDKQPKKFKLQRLKENASDALVTAANQVSPTKPAFISATKRLKTAVPPYRHLAYEQLTGHGIEIGALHQPAPIPAHCHVQYVDAFPLSKLAVNYAELPIDSFAPIDYVIDVDKQGLQKFEAGSLDFVICQDVLSCLANPLEFIKEVFRVLKQGGYCILSVPDKQFGVHKSQSSSTFEEALEAYQTRCSTVPNEKYIDNIHHVHTQLLSVMRTDEDWAQHIENLRTRRESVWFWTATECKQWVQQALTHTNINATALPIEGYHDNVGEYFTILYKN